MHLHVITIFPDMFKALTEEGVVARLLKNDNKQFSIWNPRDFTKDVHRTVDDRSYGGGPGMVFMAEPLVAAIAAAKQQSPGARVIYMSPAGQVFNQSCAKQMSEDLVNGVDYVFLCGRYEGIDQRVIDHHVDELWSLGDFVLSGGEIAAMAMIDAVVRHIPGCLGNKDSFLEDSFVEGLLDYGHYTRPENFAGNTVPAVLLSGNHALIKRWRQQQALGITWLNRPDLLDNKSLTSEQTALLDEFKRERQHGREKQDE